jgi:membrane-bound serine protease (ClpP class)
MDPQKLYIALVVSGLLLLGIEIFIPGGILGMFGGLALLGAIVVGFHPEVFGVEGGLISGILIVIATSTYVFIIMKFLPKSPIGRLLTLSKSTADYKAPPQRLQTLEGYRGEALTDLRPGGFARIDGKRTDVVAEGGWISEGTLVQVIKIDGSRVVVREVKS